MRAHYSSRLLATLFGQNKLSALESSDAAGVKDSGNRGRLTSFFLTRSRKLGPPIDIGSASPATGSMICLFVAMLLLLDFLHLPKH
jgi:hypothetical protein